jgi:hypothetical protein
VLRDYLTIMRPRREKFHGVVGYRGPYPRTASHLHVGMQLERAHVPRSVSYLCSFPALPCRRGHRSFRLREGGPWRSCVLCASVTVRFGYDDDGNPRPCCQSPPYRPLNLDKAVTKSLARQRPVSGSLRSWKCRDPEANVIPAI